MDKALISNDLYYLRLTHQVDVHWSLAFFLSNVSFQGVRGTKYNCFYKHDRASGSAYVDFYNIG